jgi:hypothetical protein
MGDWMMGEGRVRDFSWSIKRLVDNGWLWVEEKFCKSRFVSLALLPPTLDHQLPTKILRQQNF